MLTDSEFEEQKWIDNHERKRLIQRRLAVRDAHRQGAGAASSGKSSSEAEGIASVPTSTSTAEPEMRGEADAPVGLAISGGGIRSGSTAVGLLQSMYSHGLLRYVDYLSTVSGGAYAGAFLAAEIERLSDSERQPHKNPDLDRGNPVLPALKRSDSGAQSSRIRDLALAGERWKRPLKFLRHHLPGFLLVNAYLICLCVAIAALCALVFRSLDLETPSRLVSIMGFDSDLSRAFVPACVAFLCWLGSFPLRHRRAFALVNAWAYGLFIACLAMGTVSLFSTADLDVSSIEKSFGWSPEVGVRIRSAIAWLGQTLAMVFGFAVIPLLSAQRLLRSGTSTNKMERWLFDAISTTVLMGIPLMLFYYLSMEGISISAKPGPDAPRLTKSHVASWSELWREIQADRELSTGDGATTNNDERLSNLRSQLGLDKPSSREAISESTSEKKVLAVTPPPEKTTVALDELVRNTRSEKNSSSPEKFALYLRLIISRSLRETLDKPLGQKGDTANLTLKNLLREEPEDEGSFLGKFFCFPVDLVSHLYRGSKILASHEVIEANHDSLDRITHNALYSIHQKEIAARFDKGFIEKHKFINNVLQEKPNDKQKGLDLRLFNERFELELANKKQPDDPLFRSFRLDRPVPDELLLEEYRPALLLKLLRHADAIDNDDTPQEETNAKGAPGGENKEPLPAKYAERLNNWNILRVLYGPRILHSPSKIFASNVAEPDLSARFKILLVAIVFFGGLGLISVDITTMHGFYRDQLAESWMRGDGNREQMRLKDATPPQSGAPLLIINSTVNLHGYPYDDAETRLDRFTLSPLFVGSKRTGFQGTADANGFLKGEYRLADAMALSAAAVSPVADGNVLARALLVVLNLRLGQWLPRPEENPRNRAVQRPVLDYPMPHRLLWEHFCKLPNDRSFLFITDGGHHENTGIETLLVRRCRVIIAADFSEDPESSFADFRKLCLRANETLGVRVTEDPRYPLEKLIPNVDKNLVHNHLGLFQIHYPEIPGDNPTDGSDPHLNTGWLILIKPGLSGDEPTGLRECCRSFNKFPHDPTGDQLFEESRFMAYRQLGEHLGDELNKFLNEAGGTHVHDAGQNGDEDDVLWLSQHWDPSCNPSRVSPPGSSVSTGVEAVTASADKPIVATGVIGAASHGGTNQPANF